MHDQNNFGFMTNDTVRLLGHEVQVGQMNTRRSGSYTIPISISGAVVVIAVVAALVFLGVKKSKTLQGPKGDVLIWF